jgi:hypothetical protein
VPPFIVITYNNVEVVLSSPYTSVPPCDSTPRLDVIISAAVTVTQDTLKRIRQNYMLDLSRAGDEM